MQGCLVGTRLISGAGLRRYKSLLICIQSTVAFRFKPRQTTVHSTECFEKGTCMWFSVEGETDCRSRLVRWKCCKKLDCGQAKGRVLLVALAGYARIL